MRNDNFKYKTEQFGDTKILRYQIPGFEQLSLKQKIFVYYLSEAAYYGREIVIDQNYKHNLTIKRTLEAIYQSYKGDRDSESFNNFVVYLKTFWVANGIHHHYSTDKILPRISKDYFKELIANSDAELFPLYKNEKCEQAPKTVTELEALLIPILFTKEIDAKRVNQTEGEDLIVTSANNLYENVSQQEVQEFYDQMSDSANETPDEYGLNSKLSKENGEIKENVWRVGGMYGKALEKVVFHLKKASNFADNDKQIEIVQKLTDYYTSGDLRKFTEYNILWVNENEGAVDTINGFIESYADPLGYKATWEAMVAFNDFEATERFGKISKEAAWFEANSPIHREYKRKDAQGISYRVVTVVAEAGDMSPTTAIGVNLPNSEWIRAEHGSKSVSLGNIEDAYHEAGKTSGMLDEFNTPEQADRQRK